MYEPQLSDFVRFWCIFCMVSFTRRVRIDGGRFWCAACNSVNRTGNTSTLFRTKTNSTLQCWCNLVSDILKKSRLNRKLKISKTADNAGITQSQTRGARYRRMQELNSLCVSTPVVNALFVPILQYVTRYTATRLVIYINNIGLYIKIRNWIL